MSQRLVNMATFDMDGDKAWRKCWACGVRVYSTASASVGDIAPADAWVDVVLNSRVLVRTYKVAKSLLLLMA